MSTGLASPLAAPLADRMRPRTLEEFIGQGAILGQGRLLRRAIQADQLSSLIFYGPPGTGKTTLARVIANTTRAHFIALNAVLSGVKEIREAIDAAKLHQQLRQRTLLFVDEVHRFNKSQQDALLPWVENGTVILIGATTENPYFEVNKALISRSRMFQLKPLTEADLHQVLTQALQDPERGYGQWAVHLAPEAIAHLVNVANGDARTLLNALELAVETTPPDSEGQIQITLAIAEESIQRRAVLYDKEGDAHFDTISAFIKSLRGSDPDAALYWLARMVYAGEDPRFIFRRMLILAGEDVGMADPQAVVVVNACAATFDRVGMPEGRYPLAQAALYLATAPKSNSVMGFFDALAAIEQEREAEPPNALKDASRDKKGFGHGVGYLYPHAYRDHWVAQQYLPPSLQGQVFYQPSDQGYEAPLQRQVQRRREAQLAGLLEGITTTPGEVLTFSPIDRASDRWLHRALSQSGERLGSLRDRLFALAAPQRHHLILDLNAGTGLLTWEAVRQVPEGGVYACAWNPTQAAALQEQATALASLLRPMILETPSAEVVLEQLQAQAFGVKFDRILGRNVLAQVSDPAGFLTELLAVLLPQGAIVLAESVPSQSQRLYQLLDQAWLSSSLYKRLVKAEEAVYRQDPLLAWEPEGLKQQLLAQGLTVELALEETSTEMLITPGLVERWFGAEGRSGTYALHLQSALAPGEVHKIQVLFEQRLQNQRVGWRSAIASYRITR